MKTFLRIIGRKFRLSKRPRRSFRNSRAYWEQRYRNGGNSGAGSFGADAVFKASFLNSFVKEAEIESVIEFGCGDGNQLALYQFPYYVGTDVSRTALRECRKKFRESVRHRFVAINEAPTHRSELSLSIDVVYHLVEDEVFDRHMRNVFDAATKYVIIFSTDFDSPPELHVRHRQFSKWVSEHRSDFAQIAGPIASPASSAASFFVFKSAVD